jgi:cytochrome bd-type quinol oxidase subunit 1
VVVVAPVVVVVGTVVVVVVVVAVFWKVQSPLPSKVLLSLALVTMRSAFPSALTSAVVTEVNPAKPVTVYSVGPEKPPVPSPWNIPTVSVP